jgi:hypothetical protein
MPRCPKYPIPRGDVRARCFNSAVYSPLQESRDYVAPAVQHPQAMPRSWRDHVPDELLLPFVANWEVAQRAALELRAMREDVIDEVFCMKTMRQIHRTYSSRVLIGLGLQLLTGSDYFVFYEIFSPIMIYIYSRQRGYDAGDITNLLIASRACQLMRLLNNGRLF